MLGLVLMALALAGGNLWFAAARSTIPLRLDTTVVRKSVRYEKHSPLDDVCLLHTRSQGVLHVDGAVYDAVDEGDALRKGAWSRELTHGERTLALGWSADFRGLLWVMAGTVVAVLGVSAVAAKRE